MFRIFLTMITPDHKSGDGLTSMTIVFVCPSRSNGGLEMTTVRLASALTVAGMPVAVAAPIASPIAEHARTQNVAVHDFAPRTKYGDLFAVKRLNTIMRSVNATHAVLLRSQDISLAALSHRALPNVLWTFYQQMQSAVNKRDLLHRWMYSHLALWLTLTERMRNDVLRCTTMPADRIHVIPLGRDLAAFDPLRINPETARQRFSLPPHTPIVGMIGRLDPQKGQEDLLRAVPVVRRTHPKACYVIAGEETRDEHGYASTLRSLVETLGISDVVQFLPQTNDVAQLLSTFDVFVMPSHSETYGLILIEAMAMARPIIATDAGGVPELARHDKEALLVLPKSPGHLARAITRLLDSAQMRARLATAARDRALAEFGEERCTQVFLNALLSAQPI